MIAPKDGGRRLWAYLALIPLVVVGALAVVDGAHASGDVVARHIVTSSVSISSQSSCAHTIATAPSFTADGSTLYEFSFYTPGLDGANQSGSGIGIQLKDGSSVLGYMGQSYGGSAINADFPFYAHVYLTPSAGAHTYYICGYNVNTSTSTVQCGVGGSGQYMPCVFEIRLADPLGGADELADLSDVDLTGLADADVLHWDDADDEWVPGEDAEGAGGGGGVVEVSNWPDTQNVALAVGDAARLDLIWIGIFLTAGLSLGALIGGWVANEVRAWGGEHL